jgi:hypothetical protein
MLKAKITNQEKFKKVSEVDLSSAGKSIYNGAFDGNVLLILEDGTEVEADGQHGANDWKEEFGFIVEEAEISQ